MSVRERASENREVKDKMKHTILFLVQYAATKDLAAFED